MGVEKKVLQSGNGLDTPKKGDTVTMEYSGWLYDPTKPDNKGGDKPFDTSVGRSEFDTKIGVGRVIRGWDEGITTMTLGEKAVLTISSDFAYGSRGFPGVIPADSTLVFDVELRAINGKRA